MVFVFLPPEEKNLIISPPREALLLFGVSSPS